MKQLAVPHLTVGEKITEIMESATTLHNRLLHGIDARYFQAENAWGPALRVYGGLALRHAVPQPPYHVGTGITVFAPEDERHKLSLGVNTEAKVVEIHTRTPSVSRRLDSIHSLYYVGTGNLIVTVFDVAGTRPTETEAGQREHTLVTPEETQLPDVPSSHLQQLQRVVGVLATTLEKVQSYGQPALGHVPLSDMLDNFESEILAQLTQVD